MNCITLKKDLFRICGSRDKKYLASYDKDGYECGIGYAGHYNGHSHIFYTDIMFSPSKIKINHKNEDIECDMLVVPPRTYMNDVTIGDFFFIKFCEKQEDVILPDKTTKVLNENDLQFVNYSGMLFYKYYENKQSKGRQLKIELENYKITVYIDGLPEWLIEY